MVLKQNFQAYNVTLDSALQGFVMRWKDIDSQVCSVARALAVVGDNWSLLILRDCFLGIRRFDRFQKSLGVTRHRLSERLAKLVDEGVLEKTPYQERPLRYEYRLTEMGKALYPVILSLATWGDEWLSDDDGSPLRYRHQGCGKISRLQLVCSDCGEPVTARSISPLLGPGVQRKLKRGESLEGDIDQAPALHKP